MESLSIQEFFNKVPLYKKINITVKDYKQIKSITSFDEKIESYCPFCKRDRLFEAKNKSEYTYFGITPLLNIPAEDRIQKLFSDLLNKIYTGIYICPKDEKHLLSFTLLILEDSLIKIGQYPSVFDLSKLQLKHYEGILNEDKYNELVEASRLFSAGIGIGAFVYLRRILENLIEATHEQLLNTDVWDDLIYKKAKGISEKIELLKDYLPDFLVQHKQTLYSVLSKGVHELTETECLEIFPIVRTGIELILDEKLAEISKKKKIKEATQSINRVHSNLSKK